MSAKDAKKYTIVSLNTKISKNGVYKKKWKLYTHASSKLQVVTIVRKNGVCKKIVLHSYYHLLVSTPKYK